MTIQTYVYNRGIMDFAEEYWPGYGPNIDRCLGLPETDFWAGGVLTWSDEDTLPVQRLVSRDLAPDVVVDDQDELGGRSEVREEFGGSEELMEIVFQDEEDSPRPPLKAMALRRLVSPISPTDEIDFEDDEPVPATGPSARRTEKRSGRSEPGNSTQQRCGGCQETANRQPPTRRKFVEK
ncbi:hypothetical protein DL764_002855 [Monosporascus ibericus]|uniref:Uncharacterized protein n=1 Tax=Monosporascus ibericus TaxID=155417 RepID=A0A4Q4TM43_9PEZI|nr:hypothetical protein DL764_002855 [Monosporascus ibericus]